MIKKNLAEFADKRFGQNFLKEASYLRQIVEAMPSDDLPIVEIGPGLGDLTKELVKARSVTAFEVDSRLCKHLRKEYEKPLQEGRFRLHCGDVLEWWEKAPLSEKPYHLVANLPYYIATALILKALKDPQCRSILVMVQKEVALKFAAQPGEKAFSALSVLAQSVGAAHVCFEVPPEAFVPPPKVTSAVLRIDKFREPAEERFESFLKVAFAQPRKKLFRNLSAALPKTRVEEAFDTLQITADIRPHEAETSIYHLLYNALKDTIDGKQRHEQPKQTKRRKNQTTTP